MVTSKDNLQKGTLWGSFPSLITFWQRSQKITLQHPIASLNHFFVCLVAKSCLTISFSMLGKFSTIVSSKIFSYPFFFSSFSGTLIIQMLLHLILSQRSLRLSSVIFILFTLFCSSEVIPIILSSSSLIRSSASYSLLLTPSRVIVFVFSNCVLSLYVYFLILLGLS